MRLFSLAVWLIGSFAFGMDLSKAVVVVPANATSPERKAAQMLTEEIAKRTQIRLPVISTSGAGETSIVLNVSRDARLSRDEFWIQSSGNRITISGHPVRGVLFGVGYLLRHLTMDRQRLEAPDGLNISSAPRYSLRGHQLGYRPKVNTYDGWTPAQFEQYIRDLAVFGTNAIELIPPRSDDDEDSPHFLLSKIDMMEEVSRICDSYGIDVWVWYPAMDKDYSDPATVAHALAEWEEVYRRLPRIDAIFVPGGDPGHTRPKYLMGLLEKQTAALHKRHPKAQMWMSPQSFSAEWMIEWFGLLEPKPAWLSGVVYGPQVRMNVPEFRAKVPASLPVRLYPDITHSRHCQYPVPDWDAAFATTEGREVINPRPTQEAAIFHLYEKLAVGFLSYSEGVNDDVNKFVWSGLGWDPNTPVIEILRDYSRYFIGPKYTDSFAQGLLALERNWSGPLATNAAVESTMEQFQTMERGASPQLRGNWRFQQALYRAYYDYYTRARLLTESAQESEAMSDLRDATRTGSEASISRAESALSEDRSPHWARARVFEMAEALFQSIRMQLSVSRYAGESAERGANLDMIDVPLNNRGYLRARFAAIRGMASESDKLKAIDELVNWTNPGPGGFYDDLGDVTRQPHLVRSGSFDDDPARFRSSFTGVSFRGLGGALQTAPRSWWTHAETLYETPLEMQYPDLDPTASYKIRVVYAGDSTRPKIRLATKGGIEIHPLLQRPVPFRPLEFDIPRDATKSGELTLQWNRESGLGDAGRGTQIAEVWLIRK